VLAYEVGGAIEKPVNMTYLQAFAKVLEVKKNVLAAGSFKKYIATYNYMVRSGLFNKVVAAVGSDDFAHFIIFVQNPKNSCTKKPLRPKTINNLIICCREGTQQIVELYGRQYGIASNAARGLKLEKKLRTKHFEVFGLAEMARIKEACKRFDEWLLVFVKFVFYTCNRTAAIARLRVGDIDRETKTIFFAAAHQKGAKSFRQPISKAFWAEIEASGILNYPPTYYIFGSESPDEYCISEAMFYRRHRRILEYLGLQQYTLYCWKHTGVTATYLATRDIDFVSRQCRHSSLDMTKRYLRGLGLLLDYPHRDQLPELEL
jgi:integrase